MGGAANRDLVSVAIVRDVKPERVADFEAWLRDIGAAVSGVDGYAGMDVVRPGLSRTSTPRYTVILRFKDHETYAAWHGSSLRAEMLERVEDLTLSWLVLEESHGLESWFTPSDLDVATPSRHKIALLTFGGLYPLILATGVCLALLPVHVPLALATLITVGVVAPAATYFRHALGHGAVPTLALSTQLLTPRPLGERPPLPSRSTDGVGSRAPTSAGPNPI